MANLRVKNTTNTSTEFIYEISKRVLERSQKNAVSKGNKISITDALYETGDIEYCNIVTQNDEISG